MAYTTVGAIEELLSTNYKAGVSLTRYLAMASSTVARMLTCATAKGFTHTADEKEQIECALAAHYYTKTDPVYLSETLGRSSGSYVRNPKIPEPYKDMAIALDGSGCLEKILNAKRGGLTWAGKTPTEAIDWQDRE